MLYSSTREDLSIDASISYYCRTDIEEARMIFALRHKSKFNFELFWKKNQILVFPCSSSREDLSIDVSNTNVGLILTKLGWCPFSEYDRQMDRQNTISKSSHGNMSAHKNFNSMLKIKVSYRSLYASPDDEDT